jgi:hypothetical protein
MRYSKPMVAAVVVTTGITTEIGCRVDGRLPDATRCASGFASLVQTQYRPPARNGL